MPAAAAFCAASSLVRMPPVPTELPAAPAMAMISAVSSSTSSIGCASGSLRGSAVYRPSMSVAISSRSASTSAGDDGGQVVVVAQGQLVDGDGVVLVDHRQHAVARAVRAGGARVEVAAAIAHVVMRQQHLRQRTVEQPLPQGDGLGLPQRGHGLARGVAGVLVGVAGQQHAACGHRAGRDQHDLATGGMAGRDELRQAQHVLRAQAAVAAGQQAAADFQHGAVPGRTDCSLNFLRVNSCAFSRWYRRASRCISCKALRRCLQDFKSRGRIAARRDACGQAGFGRAAAAGIAARRRPRRGRRCGTARRPRPARWPRRWRAWRVRSPPRMASAFHARRASRSGSRCSARRPCVKPCTSEPLPSCRSRW